MCWVAFDRAILLARKRSLPAPLVDWMETRDAMYLKVILVAPQLQRIAELKIPFPQNPDKKLVDSLCQLTGHKTLKFVWITHQTLVAFSDEESEEASFFLPGSPKAPGASKPPLP
jgi:hypothetical protein